jgi:hypothetical protein
MGRAKLEIEFIQLDERNALIFSERNTDHIMSCIREATAHPEKRAELYGEMARRFRIDPEKMNLAVIRYVDRLKRERARRRSQEESVEEAKGQKEIATLDEKILMAALCREVGHRLVTISLSQKRGYLECERCGKHRSKYKI